MLIASLVERQVPVKVILWRGTSVDRALKIINLGSAQGEVRPNANCGPPADALSQVEGYVPGKKRVKLPEGTATAGNAGKWARRGCTIAYEVSATDLVRGDVGQDGWCCKPEARVRVLAMQRTNDPIKNYGGWTTMPDAD